MCCGKPSSSCKSCFISVGQDRQILTCFTAPTGDPELLRLILLQTIGIAGDRPPRYELRAFFVMALKFRADAHL